MARPDVGSQMGHAPLAKMVHALAEGIAQGQFDLDHQNALLARRFSGSEDPDTGENGFNLAVGDQAYSLMELGFTPTCYSISSVVLDIKMSITMSTEISRPTLPLNFGMSAGVGIFSSGIQANISFMAATASSKYQYKSEASSFVRTRLVSVPPPELLQERLENLRKKKS